MYLNRKWMLLLVVLLVGSLVMVTGCGPAEEPVEEPEEPEEEVAEEPEVDPMEEFYEGEDITMVINMSAGGGFDTFGRILASHMERHMDGVSVQVENVPGGGGNIGMNQLFAAEPDGLTVGYVLATGGILSEMRGEDGIHFELDQFEYLGRHNLEPKGLYVNPDADFESLHDVVTADELQVGTSGAGSGDHQAQHVVTSLLETNAEFVTGYGGTAELYLALARGEIDLTQGGGSGALGTVQDGDIVPIGVLGTAVPGYFEEYEPDLITDLAEDEYQEEVLTTLTNLYEVERTFAMPPGTDPDKVEYMRGIFADIAEDPEFLEDCEDANIHIEWMEGQDVADLVDQLAEDAEIIEPYLDID